jgi:hypothetical protein
MHRTKRDLVLSRAVHASLPISKLVKQRPDFRRGGGFLLHLVSVVNTLFSVSLFSVGCRVSAAGGGFYTASFPFVNHLFASRFSAVGASVVGVGRRGFIGPAAPRQHLKSFFAFLGETTFQEPETIQVSVG